MMDIKKALYLAFRETYPADSMDYAANTFNDAPAEAAAKSILFNRKYEYADSIEAILGDPFVLFTSFMGLPNYCKRGEVLSWPRIFWNMLGWEDEKELYINLPRALFAFPFHLLLPLFKLPWNILTLVTEFVPLFLYVLCDQAVDASGSNKVGMYFFTTLRYIAETIYFIGSALTSPVRSPWFYFNKYKNVDFDKASQMVAFSLMLSGAFYGFALFLVCISPVLVGMMVLLATKCGLTGLGAAITGAVAHLMAENTIVLIPIISTFSMPFLPILGAPLLLFKPYIKGWWKTVCNTSAEEQGVAVEVLRVPVKKPPQQSDVIENQWKKKKEGRVSKTGQYGKRKKQDHEDTIKPSAGIVLNL